MSALFCSVFFFFFFNDTATTEIYTLSLHDALPIGPLHRGARRGGAGPRHHAAEAALGGLRVRRRKRPDLRPRRGAQGSAAAFLSRACRALPCRRQSALGPAAAGAARQP